MSVIESIPTIFAEYIMLSIVMIATSLAPLITCSFVTICPSSVTITPDPLPLSVRTVTTESFTPSYI
jgi:hypothetical protein